MAATLRLAEFVTSAAVPGAARRRASDAVLDTVGVTLAGSIEAPARIVQSLVTSQGGGGPCRILGTGLGASATWAALANGTAAHALDYDDMCFVSLAHPSAPLAAAILAIGETLGASGRDVLDAYVVGFEVEAALGRTMNPLHYKRGWHCTSTIGTIGAAAAVARLMTDDATTAAHCLSIAASEASGVKENFGTMAKPLHAGLAAKSGVLAALLAKGGFVAAFDALDGPQGLLTAMHSQEPDLTSHLGALGSRWDILETGITVKLYPSCAATHPALDAVLDLRRRYGFSAREVAKIDVAVDSVVSTILSYERPTTGLEAKFSMQFCLAAAVADGKVGIETFDPVRVNAPEVRSLMALVSMHVDPALGQTAPPLTQASVAVRLHDGRSLEATAAGARGYPDRPASADELAQKFLACASRSVPRRLAERALDGLVALESLDDIRTLTPLLVPSRQRSQRTEPSDASS